MRLKRANIFRFEMRTIYFPALSHILFSHTRDTFEYEYLLQTLNHLHADLADDSIMFRGRTCDEVFSNTFEHAGCSRLLGTKLIGSLKRLMYKNKSLMFYS